MITQGLTTSFKSEILTGVHNLLTDTLKIALYSSVANINADTSVYTTTGEVVYSGYTAGGVTLTGVTINTNNTVAYVSFHNAVWSGQITARGALIYNASKSNKTVAVLDFGSDKTSASTFTVVFPENSYTNAIIRIT